MKICLITQLVDDDADVEQNLTLHSNLMIDLM